MVLLFFFFFGMTLSAFGRSRFGTFFLVVLPVAANAVFMHGVAMVLTLLFLRKSFGFFTFEYPRLLVAFETFLDIVAFFEIVQGLAFVIVMAFAAVDFVIGYMFFVGKLSQALLVLVV